MSMVEIIEREARLIMLRALAEQVNYALNESLLQETLETFGISKPRDWVREQLRRMEDLGAVTVTLAGSVMLARLTRHGADHMTHRVVIEGIKRPSPAA